MDSKVKAATTTYRSEVLLNRRYIQSGPGRRREGQ